MIEKLTVALNQDSIFRSSADDFGLTYFCIQENVDSNRYEIHIENPSELYYLGQSVAMEFNYQEQMKNLNNGKA